MKLITLEDELKRLRELSSNDTKQTTAKNVQNDLKPQVKNGLLINSISKTYDNRKVVNEVSMNLKRGEAVGLLGPNGARGPICPFWAFFRTFFRALRPIGLTGL